MSVSGSSSTSPSSSSHSSTPATSTSSSSSPSAISGGFVPAPPLGSLYLEWMSRSETEQFLQQTLDTIHQLDKTVLQHQIVRETTEQQLEQQAHQTFAEAAASVHMDDINTHQVPAGLISSPSSTHPRTITPTFINITPPPNGSGSGSNSLTSSPHSSPLPSPLAPRSPGSNGRVTLSPNPHPLDPTQLQVDEVSLRASPTASPVGGGPKRITPIDAILSHSPSSSPSPPGSPLASPNSMRKRLNKPLNLPSSPRLTSPSPPRSPARHIASPSPSIRLQQSIPSFYFPDGEPLTPDARKRQVDKTCLLWRSQEPVPNQGLNYKQLQIITTNICGFSPYCHTVFFDKLYRLQRELQAQGKIPQQPEMKEPPSPNSIRILLETFLHYEATEIANLDIHGRFFRLLRSNDPKTDKPRNYLVRDDFTPFIEEIVHGHPGLKFLDATPEFQLKYAQTIIARIFYTVNKSGDEKLTLRELRQSNFLQTLSILDREEDINKINDYFSYEHFYVIYCRFWELDSDHDGLIDGDDLLHYDDYALTHQVVRRIMAGAGRKLLSPVPNKMCYLDFIVFLISEVDKTSDVSLNYWFNVIDLDGDGVISTFEIELFFEEQKHRIQSLSHELITFEDIMCQLIDMVQKPLALMEQRQRDSLNANDPPRLSEKKLSIDLSHTSSPVVTTPTPTPSFPSQTLQMPTFHSHHKPFQSTAKWVPTQGGTAYHVGEGLFYKKDLRESRTASQFFAVLFNLNKFVLAEQRDPIRIKQIHDTPQLSDWDRYAISCYYRLAEQPENDGGDSAGWAVNTDVDGDGDVDVEE